MRKVVKSIFSNMLFSLMLLMGIQVHAEEMQNKIETIKLTAVGDIMMHKEQIEAGYNKGSGTYSFDYMFSAVKPYIESADIAVGNLETTLAGASKGYTGYPAFNAPEQLAWALKNTGFDVLTLANNHSLDRRFYGVEHTIKVLEEAGLAHTGTARTQEEQDRVLMMEAKGIKVAFMAYTYGTNGIPMDKGRGYSVNLLDKTKITRDIEEAKKNGADVICVSMHFGEEYKQVPSASQKEWVKFLVDQGVDIILGSHPHVLQPMGMEEESFVIYSLGNFVSAQTARPRNSSIILDLMITKNFETGETTIDSAHYIPIWTDLSRVNGDYHFRVLPVEAGIMAYEKKNDPYLTSKDYQKLQQSLIDTTTMYKKPQEESKLYTALGEEITLQTVNIAGNYLVEGRELMNRLNTDMLWNAKTSQITLQGREALILQEGVKYGIMGDQVIKLSQAPVKVGGKMYVPLRSVVEPLGYTVNYNPKTETIDIQEDLLVTANSLR